MNPPPSPSESKSPLYTSVSFRLSCIQGHHCHLSKFHIYENTRLYRVELGLLPRLPSLCCHLVLRGPQASTQMSLVFPAACWTLNRMCLSLQPLPVSLKTRQLLTPDFPIPATVPNTGHDADPPSA